MRPLIGVTTSELRPSALATTRRHGEPAHPEMALGMTYLRTLDAAGAIPVVLPPIGTDHLAPLLDRLDGICLSGGPDLDPAAYGAPERHAELGPTEPSLDAFELSLARAGASSAACRSSPSAAARRRSTSPAAARCTSTSPATARPSPATQPTHEVEIAARLAPAPDHRRPHARGQLLPPPGGRPARRRPARRRARRRTARSRRSRATASCSACSGTPRR